MIGFYQTTSSTLAQLFACGIVAPMKISTKAAADKLGVSRRRVLALIKNGQLPATWVAGLGTRGEWHIDPRDLKKVEKGPGFYRRGPQNKSK